MMSRDAMQRFHAGRLLDAYKALGAHMSDDGSGVRFVTWAPHAGTVSVVGDFNGWDGSHHLMERLDRRGLWGVFVPGLKPGAQYKFEIKNRENGRLVIKTDPYARAFPSATNQNACVAPPSTFRWQDEPWLRRRRAWRWGDEPVSIYEVHLGSWRRAADGTVLSYEALADQLVAYAKELQYTHVELLPVFEHPLDESLGYQVTGYFAPTSRFGAPDEFRAFVDRCHQAEVGVILDWVPLHFPKDDFALGEFDGAPLYERDDPEMAEHPAWHTLIFNYGRPEVRTFLVSNALYWLLEFHADGLRVDAVSSMLYLDDARAGKSWKPNPLGGRENLAAVKFLREMNGHIGALVPDALTIAEESTSWPSVSQPAVRGGLGFSMRWNMGWVHDTLRYLGLPWRDRPAHHTDLTFERAYAGTEHSVLALSHDESGQARGPLLCQMHGDRSQQLAQMRLLATFAMTYPGKKLVFMGDEFARAGAWDPTRSLPWEEQAEPAHAGVVAAWRTLGSLYRAMPALHRDFDETAFRWLDPDDASHCVLSYVRQAGDAFAVVVLNFSPNTYGGYAVRVPCDVGWRLAFASDACDFGGDGATRMVAAVPQPAAQAGGALSIALDLGPLAGAILTPT